MVYDRNMPEYQSLRRILVRNFLARRRGFISGESDIYLASWSPRLDRQELINKGNYMDLHGPAILQPSRVCGRKGLLSSCSNPWVSFHIDNPYM